SLFGGITDERGWAFARIWRAVVDADRRRHGDRRGDFRDHGPGGRAARRAGGAYNFAESAFGRQMAWLVGWAIVGEYAFASGAIAISWSGYVQSVIGDFGVVLPKAIARSPFGFDGSRFVATGATINLPAVLIMV